MSMPDLSPLIAAPLVCHSCGQTMKMKVVKRRHGQSGEKVSHLEYTCKNEETGCNYKVESTNMVQAEMRAMREDGSVVEV